MYFNVYLIKIWTLCETKNPEKILTDKIEIHIIELAKVRSTYEQNKGNKKAQWMLFLDDPNSKEVQEIMKENEEVKEAVVEVHKMTEDEKLQRLADLRQKAIMDEKAYLETAKRKGLKEGLEEGEKIGFEKGKKLGRKEAKKENSLEIAKELLKRGITKEEVANIVQLDVKELENI